MTCMILRQKENVVFWVSFWDCFFYCLVFQPVAFTCHWPRACKSGRLAAAIGQNKVTPLAVYAPWRQVVAKPSCNMVCKELGAEADARMSCTVECNVGAVSATTASCRRQLIKTALA